MTTNEDRVVWEADEEALYLTAREARQVEAATAPAPHVPAQISTHSPEQPAPALPDAGDATDAGEALVRQIAEAVYEAKQGDCEVQCYSELTAAAQRFWLGVARRAVLPLVEAQVAPLRDALVRVRALADAFADDDAPRYGGNIAWHIEEAIANEKGDFPDAADRRIASQRERADAAESALQQVREDHDAEVERLNADIEDAWAAIAEVIEDEADEGTTIAGYIRRIARARVGAADTQPEGAGEVSGRPSLPVEFAGYDSTSHPLFRLNGGRTQHGFSREDVRDAFAGMLPDDYPTPTAGSNGDAAPEHPACARTVEYGLIRYACGVDVPIGTPDAYAVHVAKHADAAPESGEGR